MSKILLGAAAIAVAALTALSAYAMGGGNGSPWASPYAILEPQTVAPQTPFGTIEGRSATGEYGAVQSHGNVAHERRRHQIRRYGPAPEQ